MREIIIDVTRLVGRRLKGRWPTGVDRVSLAYIHHYRERATALVRFAGHWVYLSREDSDRLFDELLASAGGGGISLRYRVFRNFLNRPSHRVLRGQLFLNTGHSGLDSPEYGRQLVAGGVRPLFFVHDIIPLTHPEYCRTGESERHRRRMETVLRHGRAVIANSAFTRGCLEEYARSVRQPLPPCVVAPLAMPAFPPADVAPPLSRPYFLMLGTIEPRKNHWLMLHVWRELVTRLGKAAPVLVIVGQVGWECENVMDLLDRCHDIKPHVIHHRGCGDGELVTWLRHARALLFPSFVEGFGLPLMEALELGVPVIASNLPVFREIAGGIPEYVSPIDGGRWLEWVAAYARDPSPVREGQLARMAGFRATTWREHFQPVDALLERMHGGRI